MKWTAEGPSRFCTGLPPGVNQPYICNVERTSSVRGRTGYPELDHTSAMPSSSRDRFGRSARIGGRDDRTSDDEIARPCPHRFRRSHRPHLIVLLDARRRASNPGRDDDELAAARLPDRRRLLRGCDDAVEASGLRHLRQGHHLIREGAFDPRLSKDGVVHAGEHRHADEERRRAAAGALPSLGPLERPPASWESHRTRGR